MLCAVLAWLGFSLAPVVHAASEGHRICGAHGTWSHGAKADPSGRVDGPAEGVASLRGDGPGGHADEHCRILTHRTGVALSHGGGAPVGGLPAAAVARPTVSVRADPPRHRIAPKQSPPIGLC